MIPLGGYVQKKNRRKGFAKPFLEYTPRGNMLKRERKYFAKNGQRKRKEEWAQNVQNGCLTKWVEEPYALRGLFFK
jgi:hypothetical protein